MIRILFRIVLAAVLVPPAAIFALAAAMIPGNAKVGVPTEFASSALLRDPPEAWGGPATLKVATFNIQDLPVVARNHENRMRAIGKKLGELDPDIVGFQEAFIGKHREILIAALEAHTRLRHFQYFPSGTMGSGLLFASAFPIEENWFHRFEDSNPWYKLWEGDWWAGKGVGLSRVRLPNGQLLDVYNTHAQAGYGNPAYRVVRENQLRGMAGFINASRMGTVPALAVGDFNCRPGQPDCEALYAVADLERVMTLDGGIDQILAARDRDHAVEVLETVRIDRDNVVDGEAITLSDHHGFLSTLRIGPAGVETGAPTF